MRQLASIQKIEWKRPIEGRDRIELCGVLGWQLITKKDEFHVGDLCVFIEPDAVLPDKPEFDFLRSKGFRIKTMKMAGCLSQGICFPLSILPDGTKTDIGTDVTDALGITQFGETMDTDPVIADKKSRYPKFLMRMAWFRKLVLPKSQSRAFPGFVSKTDETRIQSMPWVLTDKRRYIATEKVDGQSGTFALVRRKSKIPFFRDKFEYIVCSRNCRLWNKDNSSYWRVSEKYNIEKTLRAMIGSYEWIAIQGECIASNVQGNKYHVTEPDLFVFNLIYPTGRVDSMTAKGICEKNGLQFVPIVDTDYVMPDTVEEVLEYAHGESKLYPTLREGIVFRSYDGKYSFKAVDPLFLIKYDE